VYKKVGGHLATSSNFGTMFSMAGASLFLPFLPLLPKQILLMNLMTDMPEMTITTDNVDADAELVEKPRRWNIKFIRKFMIVFSLLSTIFDYVTFGVLCSYYILLRINLGQRGLLNLDQLLLPLLYLLLGVGNLCSKVSLESTFY